MAAYNHTRRDWGRCRLHNHRRWKGSSECQDGHKNSKNLCCSSILHVQCGIPQTFSGFTFLQKGILNLHDYAKSMSKLITFLANITVNSYSASHDNWCTGTLLNMIITTQWEGMGDVGSSRYELALLPPCPTIRTLSYSNCQRSTHSISKWISEI